MTRKKIILASLLAIAGIGTVSGFMSDMSSQPSKVVVIDEKNAPKPADFTMSIKEIDVEGQKILQPTAPITLRNGENATYKIKIENRETRPLSLGFKVFNNEDKSARDLSLAHVKFNGDVSGLPTGVAAALSGDNKVLDSSSSGEEILTISTTGYAKPGTYTIGILATSTIGSIDQVEADSGQILAVPISIQ